MQDRRNALAGIDILRKICNHPDLLQRRQWEGNDKYGDPIRSGKLVVALKVLHHWKHQGHKALLFTQTQQMLDIMERAVEAANFRFVTDFTRSELADCPIRSRNGLLGTI